MPLNKLVVSAKFWGSWHIWYLKKCEKSKSLVRFSESLPTKGCDERKSPLVGKQARSWNWFLRCFFRFFLHITVSPKPMHESSMSWTYVSACFQHLQTHSLPLWRITPEGCIASGLFVRSGAIFVHVPCSLCRKRLNTHQVNIGQFNIDWICEQF